MITHKSQLRGAFWIAPALLLAIPLFGLDTASGIPQQIAGPTGVAAGAGAAVSRAEPTAVEAAAQNRDFGTLQRLLREASASGQQSVFNSFNALDPALATESVIADFRNPAFAFRLQSLQLIDRTVAIDSQTVMNVLQDALHDTDPVVSEYALEALSRRLQAEYRPVVSGDLAGSDTESLQLAKVRFAAMDQDHSTLRDLIRTGDEVVQSTAFDALAAEDAGSAITELVSGFDDKASMNRLQSLELLLRTPYADRTLVLGVLERASNDEDPIVKSRGKQSLAERNQELAQKPSALNIAQ